MFTVGDRNAFARARSEFDSDSSFIVLPPLRLLYVLPNSLLPRQRAALASLARRGWRAAGVHEHILCHGEWDPE